MSKPKKSDQSEQLKPAVTNSQSDSDNDSESEASDSEDDLARMISMRSNQSNVSTGPKKQSEPQISKKAAKALEARQEWEDKYAAKQERRYAGRSADGKLVTVKQERSRTAHDAEVQSGVAGALQQLALKKKQKAKMKKAKKNKQVTDESDDSEEESEQEGASSINQSNQSHNQANDHSNDDDIDDGEQSDEADDHAVQFGSLEEEVDAFREQHRIQLTNSLHSDVHKSNSHDALMQDARFFPVISFSELRTQFQLPQPLLKSLFLPSFKHPTPIQAQVWPIILAGRDVIGVAETGSGKTLAFTLGALVYVLKKRGWLQSMSQASANGTEWQAPSPSINQSSEPSPAAPLALVLSPTRELATQTFAIMDKACTDLGLRCVSCTGGPSIEGQMTMLSQSRVDVIVATPGRLVKLIKANAVTLASTGFYVLDEADRMLDLGFSTSLAAIAESLTGEHQTLLLSATFPPAMIDVASRVCRPDKLVRVTIGSVDLAAAHSVTQHVEVVDRRNGRREKRLLQLLTEKPATAQSLVLVFVLYKREAETLTEWLIRHGQSAVSLHSDKSAAQRVAALQSFKSGTTPVLVATDVAARGLDVSNVDRVINFSLGLSVEHYIHRIGRCGRGGKTGTAYTFVVDYDLPHVHELMQVLQDSHAEITPELREMADRSARRAMKHSEEQGMTSDVLFAHRMKNKYSNMTAKEAMEDEIEAKIFGEDSSSSVPKAQNSSKLGVKGRNPKHRKGH